MTINELSTAGANGAGDEYVELYNACAFAIDLKDWKLHYRSAAGTSDSSLVTFGVSTVLVPGAFRVYAGSQFVGVSQGSLASALAAAGGGIGLRDITGTVRDSVGFGTATNVFVEGTVAAAPPSGQSIGRFPADGKDTNNNAADFHVATRTPGAPNL